MTGNRKKRAAKPAPKPTRPTVRPASEVRSVVLRMGNEYVDELDELCAANKRSRREIVEILTREAFEELQHDPSARIDP